MKPKESIKPSATKVVKDKRSLKAASYLCELDTNHVTFKSRATGKIFVEAHHLIPLCKHTLFKNKSVDVQGNILSLCPNCHRKIHFSKKEELEPMLKILYEKRKENLANCGLEISFEDLLSLYS